MLKFIVDTQLPPKLAKALSAKGYQAVHTTYYSNGHLLPDYAIRKIATDENRIVITKDTDFFDYYLLKGFPPKVLLLELGNIDNKALLQFIDTNIQLIETLFADGGMILCDGKKIAVY